MAVQPYCEVNNILKYWADYCWLAWGIAGGQMLSHNLYKKDCGNVINVITCMMKDSTRFTRRYDTKQQSTIAKYRQMRLEISAEGVAFSLTGRKGELYTKTMR